MEIIGHRGASFDAPENTLASFQLAWEQGADAIECDVRLSKDGQIVVIHDSDTIRVAGVDKPVADQTLDELRRLDVGRWKDKAFAGKRIPTLEAVLKTVPAGKRIFIEVKCGPSIVPELNRVFQVADLRADQTAIISFSTEVIVTIKEQLPAVKAYWCVDVATADLATPRRDLIAAAQGIRADGLDLSADPTIDADFIRTANAAALPVYVWTVNDPAVARQLISSGVAGITTDRPGWLRKQLGV